eukprot:15565408-Heterocapsa_arctica.AAC.1
MGSGTLLSALSPSSTILLSPVLPSLPPPPRLPPLSLLSLATSTTGRLSGRISVGSRLPVSFNSRRRTRSRRTSNSF